MARILVTGAAGFIGSAVCRGLAERGHQPVAGLRRPAPPSSTAEGLLLGDIAPDRDWSRALRGVGIDVIVHLAQRAHSTADPTALAPEPAAAAALARAAARAGARRFVYLSSIIAMGAATAPGRPFRAGDEPRPETPYGRSKLATEQALTEAARDSGIELAIIRPPLVHGPGVRANFHSLLRLVASGVPLPFASVDNRRSFIHADNLTDLIAVAAFHPATPGKVLLAADGLDLSTPALVRLLAAGLGRPARLFPVPEALFALLRQTPRLSPRLASLTLSLQVDDSATRTGLGWTPPVAAEAGLLATARAFAGKG
ncbi:MAG TPA: NAD-dependent epimerase/dehydratase family protein [Stellaceae bacterium]|nr:NAD-dependent epimerase/dehydratase family protein [Stellaceae bacterium]